MTPGLRRLSEWRLGIPWPFWGEGSRRVSPASFLGSALSSIKQRHTGRPPSRLHPRDQPRKCLLHVFQGTVSFFMVKWLSHRQTDRARSGPQSGRCSRGQAIRSFLRCAPLGGKGEWGPFLPWGYTDCDVRGLTKECLGQGDLCFG